MLNNGQRISAVSGKPGFQDLERVAGVALTAEAASCTRLFAAFQVEYELDLQHEEQLWLIILKAV